MPTVISGTTGIGTPAVNATGNIQAAGNVIGPGVCPAGVVLPFAISTTPTGWLVCDGTIIPTSGSLQGVDAALLQTLRGLLGTTYGSTGQLPNLQGQFIRGLTTNLSTASRDPLSASRVLGNVQDDIILNHSHTFSGTTGNDSPDHTHSLQNGFYGTNQSGNQMGYTGANTQFGSNITTGASTRHQHSFSGTTNNPSIGSGVETRPVNIALLYCIKY